MQKKNSILKMLSAFMTLALIAFGTAACDGEGCGRWNIEPTPTPGTTPTPVPTTPTPVATGACQVNYEVSDWNNNAGFSAKVTVTNTSRQPVNDWTLVWTFDDGQRIDGQWTYDLEMNGSTVTISPANSGQTTIPAGGTISFDFNGTYFGTNSIPDDFALNGAACSVNGTGTTPTPTATPVGTTPTPDPAGPGVFRVNTKGKITKNGQVMDVHCGAWFGLEGQYEPNNAERNPGGAPMELYVGNMWWNNGQYGPKRTVEQTMEDITKKGINVVRLPIAPETLRDNPPDSQGMTYVKNPDGSINPNGNLKNEPSIGQENARQFLEHFIILAQQYGIQLIIDIHSCSNYVGWRAGSLQAKPPYADSTRQNYEYKRDDYDCTHYTENAWLNDIKTIASLPEKLGVNNIMAIDIFNEPWEYEWKEWKRLAEAAYDAINSENSDILIMVEGIGNASDYGDGIDDINPNWGENLYGMKDAPLDIPKRRLILSPHTYGPSVFVQKHFIDQSDPNCVGLEDAEAAEQKCKIEINPQKLEEGWEEHFGFLRDENYAVIIGEFGGNMSWPANSEDWIYQRWSYIDASQKYDKKWQEALVDYMKEKEIEGCYWAINPESGDTGGLYTHAYDTNESGWGTWTGFDEEKWSLLENLWGGK